MNAPLTENPRVMPVQTRPNHSDGKVGAEVVLRAYEVYEHCYGAHPAMITGGCRGGFGAGELVAMLYARTFPKEEWRDRMEEAYRHMEFPA
jgi:hypothetical protein